MKSKVLGHDRLFQQWTTLLREGRLTGSFLFVGASGVGKIKAAWAFAQEALCEKPALAPCGECGSCRRVEAHQHESVLLVRPDGAQIKSEQAQTVLEFLQLQSLRSHRFILIEEAHKMNPTAANSLLKTLEEPPEGTTFLLTAPSVSAVLPTIRSRCRVFHFHPIRPELMIENKVGSEWAIWASQGRFDRLLALSDAEIKEFRHRWAAFFLQVLLSEDTLADNDWRERLKNREEVRQATDLWLTLVRDALFLQQGEKRALLNLDIKEYLTKLSQLPSERLIAIGEELGQFQRDLQFNKDAVLSLEALYIHFQREMEP